MRLISSAPRYVHLLGIPTLLLSFLIGASALAQSTVTLQEGLNNYAGTEDVDPLSAFPDTPRGTISVLNTNHTTSAILMRFKIFGSEGGPVPNNATITSATLSLYKYEGPTSTYEARRVLKNWQEMQATWNHAASGVAWQTPGALGANDIVPTADSQATAPATGWFNLDVTEGVQAFANGAANNGWRIGWVSGTTGTKSYRSRNYAQDASLRPKLTITYNVTPPQPWPPSSSNMTLQEGLNGYAGTQDVDPLSQFPDTTRGTISVLNTNHTTSAILVRFPIFAEEGGPVPNNATITSATLSLYKYEGPTSIYEARRVLKNWQEMQATWNHAATGLAWQIPGALGATDVAATADTQATAPATGWFNLDVTAGVQAFASGTPNYGWRVGWVSGTTGTKSYRSRNYQDASLRPKLTITFADPVGESAPFSGTAIQLPGTFEAENFDNGGQGVAYNDTSAANTGGQYRTSDGVDLIASTDSLGGGYVVNEFATGEWLLYTVDVPAIADYDIAIRASNNGSIDAAFRIEVDGKSVTGRVPVSSTGSWDSFQWVTKTNVRLAKGIQRLKLIADTQSFNLNQISVTTSATQPACTSGPYNRPTIEVSETIEAENFDCGGEGVGYHDVDAINEDGAYRPNEGVDIISLGSQGYAVRRFAPGEWMAYTIKVPAEATYDVTISASNNLAQAAFRLEANGGPVSNDVTVALTGSWDNYQPFTATSVTLPAGTYQLKLLALQSPIRVDRISIVPSGSEPPPPTPGTMLFWSGYEGTTALATPTDCYPNGCWQGIVGSDSATGFSWPPSFWGGTTSRIQLLVGRNSNPTPSTVGNYMANEIRTGEGRNGGKALFVHTKKTPCCDTDPMKSGDLTQNQPQLQPAEEPTTGNRDLYISFWTKFQPDLVQSLHHPEADAWRVLFAWKTASDYRISVKVVAYNGATPRWQVTADNDGNGGLGWQEFWRVDNFSEAVPVGAWFKFEIFWRRSSGDDGRVWVAINGNKIADVPGSNIGVNNARINRIFFSPLYSGGSYPMYQWQDDLQIWSGFPVATPSDPWWNPPYAPH